MHGKNDSVPIFKIEMLRVTKLIVYQIYKKIKLIRKHLQRISFSGLGKKKIGKNKKMAVVFCKSEQQFY